MQIALLPDRPLLASMSVRKIEFSDFSYIGRNIEFPVRGQDQLPEIQYTYYMEFLGLAFLQHLHHRKQKTSGTCGTAHSRDQAQNAGGRSFSRRAISINRYSLLSTMICCLQQSNSPDFLTEETVKFLHACTYVEVKGKPEKFFFLTYSAIQWVISVTVQTVCSLILSNNCSAGISIKD